MFSHVPCPAVPTPPPLSHLLNASHGVGQHVLPCPAVPTPPPLSHLLNAGHGVGQHVLEYSVDAALAGEHARSGGVIGIVLRMCGVTDVDMRTGGVLDEVLMSRCGNLP